MSEALEGPTADPKFKAGRKFWDAVKSIVSAHPKGRPFSVDANGRDVAFIPDPTPVAPPIGYNPEPSMFERMREMIRREMSAAAASQGFESFEESDDFNVEEDEAPFSPYELILEQAQPDGPVVNAEVSAMPPLESPPSGSGSSSEAVVPAGPGPEKHST